MATKTEALRGLVTARLKTLTDQVHFGYGTVSASAQGRYLVYDLQELSCTDGLTLMELEVSVMDYGRDTVAAEAMADKVQALFDHYQELTDQLQVSFYKDRRQPVYESDKNIIRRRLTFTVRLYEGS